MVLARYFSLFIVSFSLLAGTPLLTSPAMAESVFNQSVTQYSAGVAGGYGTPIAPQSQLGLPMTGFPVAPPALYQAPVVPTPILPFPAYGQRGAVSGFPTTYTVNGQVVVKRGQSTVVHAGYAPVGGYPPSGVYYQQGRAYHYSNPPRPFYRNQPLLAVLNDPTFRYATQSTQEQMLQQFLTYGATGDITPLTQADVYDVQGYRTQIVQGIMSYAGLPPQGASFPELWVEVNRFGEVTGLALLRSSGVYAYDVAVLAGLGRAIQGSLFPPTWRGNTLAFRV
ncbi:MAG: hypothetical protein ACKO37_01000 [Vampirovibrionales bacterium]